MFSRGDRATLTRSLLPEPGRLHTTTLAARCAVPARLVVVSRGAPLQQQSKFWIANAA